MIDNIPGFMFPAGDRGDTEDPQRGVPGGGGGVGVAILRPGAVGCQRVSAEAQRK